MYFDDRQAASQYERSRPFFHPPVIERIRSFLKLDGPVDRALDIGCGTGQSTRALRALATRVVGVDRSHPMLSEAARQAGLAFVAARSEQLPFVSRSVDLVTVALAFHWFQQDRFLQEAQRALRAGGWLVIYDNSFLGMMRENPDFQRWNREVYPARYPMPPRNVQTPIEAQCPAFGFVHLEREIYGNVVPFSPEELTAYLCTQSNVRAAVESGMETIDDAYAWIHESVTPFFAAARGTFHFGGVIGYLRKQEPV